VAALPATTGLTAIVPCYNEGAQVETAHAVLCAELGSRIPNFEILFVDDGSRDDTLARIRKLAATDPRVRYVSFARNFGQNAAATAGFRYAGQPWAVQLDADLQFPAAQVWKLLEEAAAGYDLVFGIRQQRKDSRLRRAGTTGTHWVARRLLGVEVPPGASSFQLVRTAVARTVVNLPTGNSQFLAKAPLVGARYTTVPVEHAPREAGRSRFRLGVLGGYAFELLFGFSWRPLNAMYLLASLAAVAGVVLGVLGAAGVVPAAAVSVAALLVSAAGVASVAIVGRYLHRRLMDARPRRLYYVREANVVVAPEDLLDHGEPAAPPPAREARDLERVP
jgi:polyisoprenyl-phosphate glycosyltransferase